MSAHRNTAGLRENLRGIIAMLLCSLFFVLNDTQVKYGTGELPLGELLFVRSALATLVVFLYVWARGSLPRIRWCLNPGVLVRSAADGGATVFYMIGLVHMPIANASAIVQVLPLVITAAGALLFGERVGWRRWLSVVIGFLGIILIVRPGGDGFNAWSLMICLAVVTLVIRELSTRFMGEGGDTSLAVLANCAVITLVSAGMALFEVWQPIGLVSLCLIVGACLCLIAGIAFSVETMLHGDVSTIAPFRYVFVLYAFAIGYFVWGEIPDTMTIAGISVVVGSGLYVIYRERVLTARARAAVPVGARSADGGVR